MALTTKQLAERMTGIGGSDAPVVVGANPYKSRYELWLEKTGQKEPFAGNDATYWGQVMEPILLKEFAHRWGVKVKRPRKTYRHPNGFMLCHLDGIGYNEAGEPSVLEVKTMRHRPKDMKEHYHYIQLQHNIAVTGMKGGTLICLFGGNEFDSFYFDRDEEMIAALMKIEGDFWLQVASKCWLEEEKA